MPIFYLALAKSHPGSLIGIREVAALLRLKVCISLFEIHTDSHRLAKLMAKRCAGLQPNVACKFKRADFLEGGMTAMRTSRMPETG